MSTLHYRLRVRTGSDEGDLFSVSSVPTDQYPYIASPPEGDGATLDPVVIGHHLQGGAAMTIEVGRRTPGEAGGLPLRVNGKLQIVEDFRLPEGFSVDQVPYFNTNTLTFDARALDRDFDLQWFLVRKKVEGREAIQFERLVGQISAFVPCICLEVPRNGEYGRFQPAKDPAELEKRRPDIERILRARGVL